MQVVLIRVTCSLIIRIHYAANLCGQWSGNSTCESRWCALQLGWHAGICRVTTNSAKKTMENHLITWFAHLFNFI